MTLSCLCLRCCNLQRALQPDLLCQVKDGAMHNRCYIFTLFTKKVSLPPPKYHCKSTLKKHWSWYIFLGGGEGGLRASWSTPVFSIKHFSNLTHLNNESDIHVLIFTGLCPSFNYGGGCQIRNYFKFLYLFYVYLSLLFFTFG